MHLLLFFPTNNLFLLWQKFILLRKVNCIFFRNFTSLLIWLVHKTLVYSIMVTILPRWLARSWLISLFYNFKTFINSLASLFGKQKNITLHLYFRFLFYLKWHFITVNPSKSLPPWADLLKPFLSSLKHLFLFQFKFYFLLINYLDIFFRSILRNSEIKVHKNLEKMFSISFSRF